MSANVLFINETTLKSRTGISDAIDSKQLKPHIKLAQDMHLQTALGSTLYLRLQAGVEADNLTANETILLNTYITDCVVWYTMSLLPMALGYQFFSKGVLQKTSEESNTPSRGDLELISSSYKSTAEFYKQRMINYLRENYSLYSEYFNTGSGYDVIFPELKAYTCPIYLGRSKQDYGNRSFSGANGNNGSTFTVYVTPADGVSSFNIPEMTASSVVLIATRSGLVKGVTNAATANTMYLQINGTTCTLPTGDIVGSGEIFSFTYR
jgi:hypothetical protein